MATEKFTERVFQRFAYLVIFVTFCGAPPQLPISGIGSSFLAPGYLRNQWNPYACLNSLTTSPEVALFVFVFLGSFCFPLTRQTIWFFAGVLVPAKTSVPHFLSSVLDFSVRTIRVVKLEIWIVLGQSFLYQPRGWKGETQKLSTGIRLPTGFGFDSST